MSEDSTNEQGAPPTDEVHEVHQVTGMDQGVPTTPDEDASGAQPSNAPPTRRRMIAAMAVVALTCGAAGTAAGLAIGHRSGGAPGLHSAASEPGRHWSFTWPPNGTTPGNGSGGSGGLGQQPGNGFGQNLQNRGIGTATSSQLTGMVRVASTLTNGAAAGTGMVLTSTGEVVTNNHVVDGSTKLQVKVMATGTTYTARVVGTDPTDDVAVLRLVGASGLTPVSIDHDPLAVGAKVTAVGDAGGTTGRLSSSPGTVSGLGRSITTESELADQSEHLSGLIQIAADVISGDSGGAVLDSQGEVTGMTTAAGGADSLPTGYAIPIAKVLRVAGLIESGQASSRIHQGYPAFLGVELSSQTNTATIGGVVAGSPAQGAGLTAGDTITSVGGTAISNGTQLRAAIVGHAIGDSLTVTWLDRTGSSHSATVTLVEGPAD